MRDSVLLLQLVLVLVIIVLGLPAGGQEFRSFNRIPTPSSPKGKTTPVSTIQPVETTQAKTDLEAVFRALKEAKL